MCPHSGHFSVTFTGPAISIRQKAADETRYATLSWASEPSCVLVCVFRFCLSADGIASGWDRVVISMFSYAARH